MWWWLDSYMLPLQNIWHRPGSIWHWKTYYCLTAMADRRQNNYRRLNAGASLGGKLHLVLFHFFPYAFGIFLSISALHCTNWSLLASPVEKQRLKCKRLGRFSLMSNASGAFLLSMSLHGNKFVLPCTRFLYKYIKKQTNVPSFLWFSTT